MCKRITLLSILIICFLSIVNGAFAMLPRVKFPEWNKTSIKITDWDPLKGILTLTVTVEANKIPLEKVSSQPYLQSNFNMMLSKYEKENIKQGDKVTFVHKLNIKSNTHNWLELDLRAKPDITGLKLLIRSEHKENPIMRDILEAEADQIKAPIFIGTSMPILVRDDIAMSVTPEIAFTPTFIHNKTRYYIWMPLDSSESQTTNSAVKIFRESVEEKNLRNIEAAGQNLLKRFDTDKRTIVFKKENGDNFAIPTKVARDMLSANIACLKAILTDNPEELEKTYRAMNPSYSKAFIAYNLYALLKTKNKDKAEKYKNEALQQQPAWPLLLKVER